MTALCVEKREVFGTCSRVLLELTEQARSFHDRVLFFDAAHHHAKVFRFDHDPNAAWFQTFHQRVGDLNCELFLDLQTARENIDNARDLRKPDYLSVWNVSDVGSSDERKQVMLAHRIELDVFDQNDLARFGTEDCAVDDLVEVLAISVGKKLECARGSGRRS